MLTQEAIYKACFEPLILVYKNRMAEQSIGDKTMVKEQFYKELTKASAWRFLDLSRTYSVESRRLQISEKQEGK